MVAARRIEIAGAGADADVRLSFAGRASRSRPGCAALSSMVQGDVGSVEQAVRARAVVWEGRHPQGNVMAMYTTLRS
jgi:hypothetical protein